MSDLVGNQNVGFLMMRLIFLINIHILNLLRSVYSINIKNSEVRPVPISQKYLLKLKVASGTVDYLVCLDNEICQRRQLVVSLPVFGCKRIVNFDDIND